MLSGQLVQGYLSQPRIRRCAQSAGGTNYLRVAKSIQKTSLADSITNIGWRKWQPRIQTEFLRTDRGGLAERKNGKKLWREQKNS